MQDTQYAQGKTPLSVRVERYVLWFGAGEYIPIHPREYWKLMGSQGGYNQLQALGKQFGAPIVPLGYGQ